MADADASRVKEIADAFLLQADWCGSLGSPFTATLLRQLTEDLERGGTTRNIVRDFADEPVEPALALRLARGLHFLVLSGKVPRLAAHFGASFSSHARSAFAEEIEGALADHQSFLTDFIRVPVQTNEVGRSIGLLGGFLHAAAQFSLPIRLFELGSSAGLNLLWDRYHYRIGDQEWGPHTSQVRLDATWSGGQPPLEAKIEVVERRGCDLNPIRLDTDESVRRAEAYIWADQTARLDRFRAAAVLVRQAGLRVEQADAGEWLAERLVAIKPGTLTVVFHSIFWQYTSPATRARIDDAIRQAGETASHAAPLAHLRFEPETARSRPEIRLTFWPGGTDSRLAWTDPHCRKVEWLAA